MSIQEKDLFLGPWLIFKSQSVKKMKDYKQFLEDRLQCFKKTLINKINEIKENRYLGLFN